MNLVTTSNYFIDMEISQKPRILLVNNAIYVPGEGGYKRTLYMFDMMKNLGYDVTLLTSTFNHYAKKQRDVDEFRKRYPAYNDIQFIKVPSYAKNISLRRVISGKVWIKGFKSWFKKHASEFDVVYHNMPAMDTILAAQPISEEFNHKVVVDVRDLRPEVFKVILKNDKLYQLLTYFMKKKADRAYACADLMFAVSEEYLQRGMSANTKAKDSKAVYIGAILDKFYSGIEKYGKDIHKSDGEIWVTYAGTLGVTYDLFTLLDSAKAIQDMRREDIQFKILGQGPSAKDLEEYAEKIGVTNVEFVGFVPYEKMAAYLSKSDMTVNSLKARASQSIINKVADYFAAGIPILNGSLCKEMQNLVSENNLGINFIPENVDSLTESILNLSNDKELRLLCGRNAKRVAEEKFDRKNSYLEILKRIDALYNANI